jgi:glutamine synthetase
LEAASDTLGEVRQIVRDFYRKHKRVVFNGNGYAAEWLEEASRRKLENLPDTVEALSRLHDPRHVELFGKHRVFSSVELHSRQEIYLETYAKQIAIEAGVMIEMAGKMVYPAVNRYLGQLLSTLEAQQRLGLGHERQAMLATALSDKLELLLEGIELLSDLSRKASGMAGNPLSQASFHRSHVVPAMGRLRSVVDSLEELTDKAFWPYPSYEDMLFRL